MLSSRKEANYAGESRYFTGKPCKHGHITLRRTDNGDCVDCIGVKNSQYNRIHAEDHRSKVKIWRQTHPELRAAAARRYRKAHPELCAQTDARHAKKHPEKLRALNAKRRAAKLKATPPWLTPEHHAQIQQVYRMAQLKELLTKQPFHVDHIYPLQGNTSSGLHVPWNLQVITAQENSRKNNRLPVV